MPPGLRGSAIDREAAIWLVEARLRLLDRSLRRLRRGDGWFLGNVPPSGDDGRARVDCIEVGRARLVVLLRRFGSAKTAIGKLYAEHPNEPDIVERTLLDLGPIVVAPGEPVEQTILLPVGWFR